MNCEECGWPEPCDCEPDPINWEKLAKERGEEMVRLTLKLDEAKSLESLLTGRLLHLLESMPPAPWYVDAGTMADKMLGCWLVRSADRHDFPSWLLATSGHKDAKEIAELVC